MNQTFKNLLRHPGTWVFVGVASVLGIVAISANAIGRSWELRTWPSKENQSYLSCAGSGFPKLYKVDKGLPTKHYDVPAALDNLNKQVAKRYPDFGPVWKKAPPNYSGPLIVFTFKPAPPKFYQNGNGPDGKPWECSWASKAYGSFYRGDLSVYICVDKLAPFYKYKTAAQISRDKSNVKLKEIEAYHKSGGSLKVLVHEGAHSLWYEHPEWGGGLMDASPSHYEITSHEFDLLKFHYEACKKAGKLNQPL